MSRMAFILILALGMAVIPPGVKAVWASEDAHGGGGGDSHGGGAPSGAEVIGDGDKTHYVKISPLILPVIGENGVEQVISLVVMLEVATKDDATAVIQMSPRLNDAFITDLYGAIDRRERMSNGLINVAHIKDRMMNLAAKIMGQGKVLNILVQGVTQRPA